VNGTLPARFLAGWFPHGDFDEDFAFQAVRGGVHRLYVATGWR
jgi:hypothetical protein